MKGALNQLTYADFAVFVSAKQRFCCIMPFHIYLYAVFYQFMVYPDEGHAIAMKL